MESLKSSSEALLTLSKDKIFKCIEEKIARLQSTNICPSFLQK